MKTKHFSLRNICTLKSRLLSATSEKLKKPGFHAYTSNLWKKTETIPFELLNCFEPNMNYSKCECLKDEFLFDIYSSVKYIFRLLFGTFVCGKKTRRLRSMLSFLEMERRSSFMSATRRERRNLWQFNFLPIQTRSWRCRASGLTSDEINRTLSQLFFLDVFRRGKFRWQWRQPQEAEKVIFALWEVRGASFWRRGQNQWSRVLLQVLHIGCHSAQVLQCRQKVRNRTKTQNQKTRLEQRQIEQLHNKIRLPW